MQLLGPMCLCILEWHSGYLRGFHPTHDRRHHHHQYDPSYRTRDPREGAGLCSTWVLAGCLTGGKLTDHQSLTKEKLDPLKCHHETLTIRAGHSVSTIIPQSKMRAPWLSDSLHPYHSRVVRRARNKKWILVWFRRISPIIGSRWCWSVNENPISKGASTECSSRDLLSGLGPEMFEGSLDHGESSSATPSPDWEGYI